VKYTSTPLPYSLNEGVEQRRVVKSQTNTGSGCGTVGHLIESNGYFLLNS